MAIPRRDLETRLWGPFHLGAGVITSNHDRSKSTPNPSLVAPINIGKGA
jgi:hypothetical protein